MKSELNLKGINEARSRVVKSNDVRNFADSFLRAIENEEMSVDFVRLGLSHLTETFGSALTVNEVQRLWDQLDDHLNGCMLVYSGRGAANGAAPARVDFEGGAAMRSFFSGQHLTFLDRDIWRRMKRLGGTRHPIDYSVSFDTHFVSYIAAILQGRPLNLEPRVRRVLDYATVNKLGFLAQPLEKV